MFVTKKINEKLWIRYLGNTHQELLLFYKTLYRIKDREFYQEGYLIPYSYKSTFDKLKSYTNIYPSLKYQPFDYQKEAIEFCLKKKSALLRMCCGSGKTLVLIAIYVEAKRRGIIKNPGMVVVKASLKNQWESEIKKFSYLYTIIIQRKTTLCASELKKLKKAKSETDKVYWEQKVQEKFEAQFQDIDLFVLNYETLNDDDVRNYMHKIKLDFVAGDEIHYAKNHTTQRTRSLHEFGTAKIKIGSTATPIQKDYGDIFGIFKFLVPDMFQSHSRFAHSYITYNSYGQPSGFKNIEQLMFKIKPYVFTKTDEDIASQLPQINGPIQLWCNLDKKVEARIQIIFEELEYYKEEERKLAARLNSREAFETSEERLRIEARILALQTFSQELCNAPELLENSDSAMAQEYAISGNYTNPKLDLLVERVMEIIDSGEKVCIFSRFERMQSIFENRFLKEDKRIKIAKVSGSISGERRYEEVYNKFRDDPDYKILLASNALAEGANLSRCKYLIEYDIAESYAIQNQRHGRIRRADSIHQSLFVYQILSYNSWDEVALKIVSKKENYDTMLNN